MIATYFKMEFEIFGKTGKLEMSPLKPAQAFLYFGEILSQKLKISLRTIFKYFEARHKQLFQDRLRVITFHQETKIISQK